jgi:hypothetical protein
MMQCMLACNDPCGETQSAVEISTDGDHLVQMYIGGPGDTLFYELDYHGSVRNLGDEPIRVLIYKSAEPPPPVPPLEIDDPTPYLIQAPIVGEVVLPPPEGDVIWTWDFPDTDDYYPAPHLDVGEGLLFHTGGGTLEIEIVFDEVFDGRGYREDECPDRPTYLVERY